MSAPFGTTEPPTYVLNLTHRWLMDWLMSAAGASACCKQFVKTPNPSLPGAKVGLTSTPQDHRFCPPLAPPCARTWGALSGCTCAQLCTLPPPWICPARADISLHYLPCSEKPAAARPCAFSRSSRHAGAFGLPPWPGARGPFPETMRTLPLGSRSSHPGEHAGS